MIELYESLWDFWRVAIPYKDSYLPVFHQDGVPEGQAFPYLTYQTSDLGILKSGFYEIFIWTRQNTLEQLANFETALHEYIPAIGKRVLLKNKKGSLILYRGNPFIQGYAQEDKLIKSCRALIEVRSYIL